jgi:hypothetical protein
MLHSFAAFAESRAERFIQTETVLEWAKSAPSTCSPSVAYRRRHADSRLRLTSRMSNGLATTSHAPRFRASAQSRSSASREVTTNGGGSATFRKALSRSTEVPFDSSRSQSTTDILRVERRARAASSLSALSSGQDELMMALSTEWSCSNGLIEQSYHVSLDAIALPLELHVVLPWNGFCGDGKSAFAATARQALVNCRTVGTTGIRRQTRNA